LSFACVSCIVFAEAVGKLVKFTALRMVNSASSWQETKKKTVKKPSIVRNIFHDYAVLIARILF
jgi:hypothetical protein